MKNPKEVAFYNTLRKFGPRRDREHRMATVGCVMAELGISGKQGIAWLEKWTAKGWWNYGVSPVGGWFATGAPDALIR